MFNYATGVPATFCLIASVVRDLGRSIGIPSALSQHKLANTPNARETPNSTV